MQEPELAHNEALRLAALQATGQLDTPIEERFEMITRMARRLLDVPIAAISLLDADRQWFKSIGGLAVQETGRDISFCGHTILDNDIMVVPDARKDSRFADNPLVTGPPNIVFYAGCPIQVENECNIATVCLIDTRPRELCDEDLAILRDLAALARQQLTLTMQDSVQADLLNQIRTERKNALVDPLTRLWNRDGIGELLDLQIVECARDNEGVGLIIVDIDHFKKINDSHGHPIGDDVLREVAKRLLQAAHRSDSVGRFGGEEFLIVLGHCESSQVAHAAAEKLRTQLSARPISTPAGELDITASFGATYISPSARPTATELISTADAALYQAKADGRNRCCSHKSTAQAA